MLYKKNIKRLLCSWLLCLINYTAWSQANITKVEYYIDADPGLGMATNVPITAAKDINNATLLINTTGLSTGVHQVVLRAQAANGVWSLNNTWLMVKTFTPIVQNVPNNIAKIEYYVDADPGLGKANNIPIAAGADIANTTFNLDINNLDIGIHQIVLRAQAANGVWSLNNTWLFVKAFTPIVQNAPSNITKVEYYIDADPGLGKATNIPVTAGVDIANTAFDININSLNTGVHQVVLRAQNANGVWSHNNAWLFVKDFAKLLPRNREKIVQIEYFLDNLDPGLGKAKQIAITPDTAFNNMQVDVKLDGLNAGNHFVRVRAKDATGVWSLVSSLAFNTTTNFLPVHLATFTATAQQPNAVLNWQSLTETNTKQYNIQRSSNGVDFETISTVAAKGNSSVAQQYAYTDNNAATKGNVLFYRLKMVDNDNSYSYSSVQTVKFSANNKVLVYPNPASNSIVLNAKGGKQVQIFNVVGKLAFTKNLTSQNTTLNISTLTKGLYNVVTTLTTGEVVTEKLIKQ